MSVSIPFNTTLAFSIFNDELSLAELAELGFQSVAQVEAYKASMKENSEAKALEHMERRFPSTLPFILETGGDVSRAAQIGAYFQTMEHHHSSSYGWTIDAIGDFEYDGDCLMFNVWKHRKAQHSKVHKSEWLVSLCQINEDGEFIDIHGSITPSDHPPVGHRFFMPTVEGEWIATELVDVWSTFEPGDDRPSKYDYRLHRLGKAFDGEDYFGYFSHDDPRWSHLPQEVWFLTPSDLERGVGVGSVLSAERLINFGRPLGRLCAAQRVPSNAELLALNDRLCAEEDADLA